MKNVEWGIIFGDGLIVCTCDCCGIEEEIEFDDGHPDYRQAQSELFELGWSTTRVKGSWKDFCSESCRNKYIKENT